MTDKIKSPPPILICIAAIVVNLLGSFVAKFFALPIYLDTVGTIFIAMMSGYVPGVIVGFATNLLNSLVDESEMYYCSISIIVALYTTFLARRGYFQKFSRTLMTILPLTLITTILVELIENFLLNAGVERFSAFELHFTTIFLCELVDKGLIVLAMFFVVKFVPPRVKKIFADWGQRQAPLSADVKSAVYARKCPISSLRVKVLLIFTISAVFIAASIASISHRIFEQAAFAAQINIAETLTTVVANEIEPSRVDDYIKLGHAAPDYDAVEKKIRVIKDSNDDIKFLSVYKVTPQGFIVVFDMDTDGLEASAPGEFVAFDDICPSREDLIAGNEVPPIIFDGKNERLLTIFKPVYDANGKCVCYATIDFSLNLIAAYGRTFIAKVLALFSGCFVFIFVLGSRFVENNIILPVNTMEYCAKNFAYDNDEFCANNVEQLKRLKIHTGDEIENLYHALLKTTQDVLTYLEKLRRAKRQVAEMDELAHKDSLTGIKNKAAYDEAIIALDKKISEGTAHFCIAMVDVNFLKRVNDTFGHERGNIYLMNAVKLICAVFGEEHVYRIGGDEFVVILEGDKVSLSKYFVTQFVAEMERKNSSATLEPWEKVSAAVGVANFGAGDKTAEEVFKRADAQMYENKLAMKANRRD